MLEKVYIRIIQIGSIIWQVIAIQSHNRIDFRSIKDYSWPLLTTAKGVFYTQKMYLTIRLILVMQREKKSMFLQWLYEKEASKTKLIRARQQLVLLLYIVAAMALPTNFSCKSRRRKAFTAFLFDKERESLENTTTTQCRSTVAGYFFFAIVIV